MHKKITSLLLVLSLLFGMVSSALPVFAEGEELIDIIIEADKTEANPGDIINYDVSIGPVADLSEMQFRLDIPEGLTFVEGSLADGLQDTLGAGECTFDSETQKVVISGDNTGDDNTTVYYVKVNAPTENGKYVIVADGHALDRNDTDSTTSSGTTYSGYIGTEVSIDRNNITSEVTDTMIWDVESANGGYYIKADGQYLNAEYSSSGNSRNRAITLIDNAETWSYSNNLLGTSDNNSNCYLIYHEDGSIFTVRSNTSEDPDNVTFYKVTTDASEGGDTDDGTTTPDTPSDPDTDSITQATAFENGKSYIIVSNGYALKNDNGSVEAVAYNGTPADITGLLWTAESDGSGFVLKNGNQYLTVSGSSWSATLSLSSSGSVWAYSNSRLTASISGSTNYLYYSTSQNKFAVSTTESSSSSPRDVDLYAVSAGDNTGNEGGNEGGGNTNPPSVEAGNYVKVDAPTENGKYVIVADGRALDRSDTVSSTSTYSGYIGTVVTVSGNNIISDVTDTMIWDVESTDGGYYIMADGQYLNAEYSRSGNYVSDITLDDNAEAWRYTTSNGYLTTADNNGSCYLYYYDNSMFTVRSSGQDVTFYKVTETDSEDDNTDDINTQNNEVALVNVTTNDVMTYDINEKTLILSFSCIVNEDFTGETKVSVTDDSYCVVNGENVSFNKTDAIVNIVEPPCPHTTYVENADAKYLVSDADCVNAAVYYKSCEACGEASDETFEYGEALGHTWTDATCTEPKTCERCAVTEGEALDHDYSNEWSKDDEAHWHDCIRCDATNDREEHDFGDDFVCECGYEYNHEHDLTLVDANDPTCIEDGNKAYYTCSGCDDWFEDAEGTVKIENKDDFKIVALDHDMVTDAAVEATCTETGLTAGEHCSRCDDATVAQKVIPALNHDMVTDEAVEATCTESGLTAGEHCTRCDDATVAQKVIPALGHDWNNAAAGDAKICDRCGLAEWPSLQLIITADKSAAKPTDTITYSVSLSPVENIAGVEFQIVIPEGLTFVSGALVPGLQQTLDAGACDFNDKNQKVVIGGGMHYTSTTATPILTFTCTVDKGFTGELLMGVDTENWYFETSSDVLEIELANSASKVNVSCNHGSYVDVVADEYFVSAATCVNKAVYYKSCEFCGLASTTETFEYGNPLGHNWADATCTESKTCTVCKVTEGAELGHSFTNYVPNGDETCSEDGTKTAKCDRCEVTDTIVDTGSAGHKWVDANCEDAKTCSACGETEGEALGHTWVDATCTKPETCTVCGETRAEALGHDFADATDVLPEICNTCGMTNNVKVQLIITADKDEAKIGDTITYTVSVGPVYKIAGIEFQMDIPEGLTFVSGALVPGVQQVLGAGACNFNDKNLKVVIGGGMAYTSAEATPILTFSCTVDDEFFGDLLMSVDTDNWYIEDAFAAVEIVLANEDSEVYVACTHPGTTDHDAVASTCTVPGHEAYTSCDKCGDVVEGSNEPLELDPDNHSNIVTYEAVAGTCLKPGHAEYTKCEDCDVIISGSDEPTIDPHGNVRLPDEKYLKSAADCNNPAVYYMHCAECGEANVTATFTSGSPIAHNWADATCTEPSTCTLCGTTNGNALGHNWKDATYDEPKTCERCGITEGETLAKFSVIGNVTSFGSETDAITVQVTDSEGNVVHTTTVSGNNAAYSIADVKPGTYTMTVSKNGHVTRAYTVTVGTANVTQDAMIAMLGDVNFDGRISLIDGNIAYNHVVETSTITDDYAFMCADVNGDGKLDMDDCEILYNYLLGI